MFLFAKTIYFIQCSKQDIFFKALLGKNIKSTLLLRTIIPDLSVWLTGLKMLLMEWQGIGFEGLGIFICICICICMEWQGIGFDSIFKHCLIFKTCFQFRSDFFHITGTLVRKGTLPSRLQGIFNLKIRSKMCFARLDSPPEPRITVPKLTFLPHRPNQGWHILAEVIEGEMCNNTLNWKSWLTNMRQSQRVK